MDAIRFNQRAQIIIALGIATYAKHDGFFTGTNNAWLKGGASATG